MRIYHFLHKLNVLRLVKRDLVAKRVLCINMHVVNSMYACVSNPMKYRILREMEWLEFEIFFDIDVKLLGWFKFTMISKELLMMADRVMI